MAKYRPIKTEVWEDDWFYSLSAPEKLIWIFLLTNDRTSLCGIYKVSIGYVYRMTKVSEDTIKKALERFEQADKATLIDNQWISIKNIVKHHSASPKITDGMNRELAEIPQEIAKLAYPIHRVGINLNFNLNSNLTLTNTATAEKENKFSSTSRITNDKGRCSECREFLPKHAPWHSDALKTQSITNN
jgi:hypothetical protein